MLLWHGTFTINSLAHLFGTRRYDTTDDTRNNSAARAHHDSARAGTTTTTTTRAPPTRASSGGRSTSPTTCCALLQLLGLVWDVRRPPRHVVAPPHAPEVVLKFTRAVSSRAAGRMSPHRGIARSIAALVVAAAALTATPPAQGYVRYRTATGLPFAWKTSCVRVTAYPAALGNLTRDQTSAAIAGGVAAWSKQDPALDACSYLDLVLTVAAASEAFPPARNDGTNNIGFLQDSWCSHDRGRPADVLRRPRRWL